MIVASSWREPSPASKMVEVRCKNCRRLLLRAEPKNGRIEIVCPDNRCKRYNNTACTTPRHSVE
jgi:phage FluMu protein Com